MGQKFEYMFLADEHQQGMFLWNPRKSCLVHTQSCSYPEFVPMLSNAIEYHVLTYLTCHPAGLAMVESQRLLYISGNHQIQVLDLESGNLSLPAPEASFQSPAGLVYNEALNFLYVSDSGSHAVYSLNLTAESPMPMVVAGRPGHPGGPGDGSTFISRSYEGKLNRPDGLALDAIGQRLFIGDSTKAIRIVDLITENMTLAAVRTSFQHESGHLGPIGLALGNTTVPGFKVESIWHNPLIGGPPTFGNYFYFQSSKGYASSHLSDLKHLSRGFMNLYEIFGYADLISSLCKLFCSSPCHVNIFCVYTCLQCMSTSKS